MYLDGEFYTPVAFDSYNGVLYFALLPIDLMMIEDCVNEKEGELESLIISSQDIGDAGERVSIKV